LTRKKERNKVEEIPEKQKRGGGGDEGNDRVDAGALIFCPETIQGDQKVSMHLMITTQKVTNNVQ
jgi:hypothetical protein